MKDTFLRLSDEKKRRIIDAAINEFGTKGYENGSLDRIVECSNISKGGLYEYIFSKEDFFLYLVEFVYSDLYRFLEEKIGKKEEHRNEEPLVSVERAARHAVDYYFANVNSVRLLERNIRLEDQTLLNKSTEIFKRYFDELFQFSPEDKFIVDTTRTIDLLRWILLKTRSTFLFLYDSGANEELIRNEYLDEWKFHMRVLRKGIYHR